NSHKFASKFACSPSYQSSFLAYVPVMNGCNNYCSYCVVPYTRGREKSRPTDKILKEVNKLIVQGYKHIILLGQNVNSYCLSSFAPHLFNPIASSTLKAVQSYSGQAPIYKKNRNSSDFAELLKQIDQIPGNYWLSFITSHPKDLSDDLIKCFKNCQHLIPYLHLPIQSGSNKILKDMNRKYTTEKYLKLIEKIRKTVPDINLSTDIIVGFPNETKKDFNDTIKVMKKAKFDMAYIAQYSPRPGTAASKLKDNVSKTEKKTREKILTEILKKTALENNKKMMGKIVDVLIENRRNEALPRSREYFGRTRNFKNIKFTVNNKQLTVNNLIGKFVKVKITKINPWNLEGKLICNADL
ncbi:MAG: MiaB/RimO family radical SAM methylthiotransferase, partial [Candidatus Falkowbacteria bacterium]